MTNLCTFFNAQTGEVHGAGSVGDDTLEGYFQTGIPGVRLEVAADRDTQYIDLETLEVRDYSVEEMAARRAMRTGWVWQMPERIAVDQRPIEQVRAQAWERVKAQRAVAEAAPFMCDGKSYDADRERITGAVTGALMAAMADVPYSVLWTLADNTTITLDGAGMMGVGATLSQRVKDIFAAAAAAREQIATEDDVAILDGTNLPT